MSERVRRALVTGVTGQDGSFLAEQLLGSGYEVWGMLRGGRTDDLGFVAHLRDQMKFIEGELAAPESLTTVVKEVRPDELYHLAAPTFVPDSWLHPADFSAQIVGATATLLEAVCAHSPETRLLLASSGEIFGDAPESPQTESTPCRPRNPYAVAKLAAHQLVGRIREHSGVFACSAIMFNHESERRLQNFVSRKITRAAAAIKLGLEDEVTLGDTSAIRDWSFAGDVMRGCILILEHPEPRDFVLASGVGRTVADLLNAAFAHVGLEPSSHVRIDETLVRAPETTPSVGDPSRARAELGWHPTLTFEQLVGRMVDADLRELAER